jgi:spore maturation protein CgeB
MKLRITIFGLSISSSWGNGHATTFRALCAALKQRGHEITFFEKDVEWYASNRDLPDPPYADLHLYSEWEDVRSSVRKNLRECDVAVVGSYFPDGISALREVIDSPTQVKAFYDVDTPITMAALRDRGRNEYVSTDLIRDIDLYFSFTGGPALRELEGVFGVHRALPLHCSFDPDLYYRVPSNARLRCSLSYMGTYAEDRQPRVEEFLSEPARRLPDRKFIVAGPMYPASVVWPNNVDHVFHLEPMYHPALYSSSDLVLNVTRREMIRAGYSPSVRLFEAAACASTIISDNWPGLDHFFAPGEQILLPTGPDDVVQWIRSGAMPEIGIRAQQRVLAEHSSAARAQQFEAAVMSARSKVPACA